MTKSRLLAGLIMLGLFALCIRLAFWQLHRADEKAELVNAGVSSVEFAELLKSDFLLLWVTTEISGRFLNEQPYVLDNQTHNGQQGYEVFSRFQESSGEYLLVNRGWLPINEEADVPDSEPLTIRGIVAPYRKAGMRLGPPVVSPPEQRPVVVNYPSHEEWQQLYQSALLPFTLWLAPEEANGYVRNWQLQTAPPEKHLGYAFQWFAMATAVVVIGLILLVRIFRGND